MKLLLLSVLLLSPSLAFAGDDYPAAQVAALVSALASADAGEVDRAYQALEKLCVAAGVPGAEAARKAVAASLLEALASSSSVPARVLVLRLIELVGKAEAVPALGKLLGPANDPALREGARRALEANPHVNAKKELRGALRGADGAFRLALIQSIGAKRDFLATADLTDLAAEGDAAVKLAAIDALAQIGEISAVSVIEAAIKEFEGADLAVARRAYLRLADSLVRNGERGSARRIYEKALDMGPALRAAGILGFARAGLQMEVDRVAAAFDDADPVVRGAAREAVVVLAGEPMTKALLARLEKEADGERRIELLELLARRSGAAARQALLLEASEGKSPAARAAALEALGKIALEADAARAVETLVAALATREVAASAETSLSRLPGPVGEGLLRAAGAAQGDARVALLRVLGSRRDPAALETLASASKDPAPAVRLAAIAALGKLGVPAAGPALIAAAAAAAADEAERQAVVRALAALRESDEAILSALSAASGHTKATLLRALGWRGGPGSFAALKAALGDGDAAVRAAAIEGLARSSEPASFDLLRPILESGSPVEKAAAARGVVRWAERLAATDRARSATLYRQVLAAAAGEDEQRTALRGLAETGEPDALDQVRAFLKPGPLQRHAGRAALRLAERLPEGKQAGARELYEKLLELELDDATATQCVRRLRRLGVDVDFARRAGFVTRWWIIAPLPNPRGALWEKELPPEKGVDVTRPLEYEGVSYAWKRYHTPSPRGLVALEDAGYAQSEVGAYLYAELGAKEARDALLKLGSDDQVACWLNGRKVHEHRGNRGLTPDDDTIEVKLEAGANRLLLKVLNDGGGWGACARFTARDGRPLELTQQD